MGPQTGAPKLPKRGRWSLDRPPFDAKGARPGGLQLFSKQFRKEYSRKFVFDILHIAIAVREKRGL
jgi:hypothetical protein